MGLLPSLCRGIIRLHQQAALCGPVLTLGNQDVWATHDELKSYFRALGCPYREVAPLPHTSKMFASKPETRDFVHARTFFGMLGLGDYYDMDKFEADRPVILHDLNEPIPGELEGKFNLVLDGGTMEHIFDVRRVTENVVRLCAVGGHVLHLTPSSNYLDHGFFSFSPVFFYDFYRANGFEDFRCWVMQIDPEDARGEAPYFDYSYGMDTRGLFDPKRQVLTFFSARKAKELPGLVVPTQGVYADAQAEAYAEPGGESVVERLVPKGVLPLVAPLRPAMGRLRRKAVPAYKRLKRM